MANSGPATVTITSTTGPGQAVTALKFTDVTKLEFDYTGNTIKITRTGSGSSQSYDYSAMATMTVTISNGLTSITISS